MFKYISAATLSICLLAAAPVLAQSSGMIDNANINATNEVNIYSGANASGNDGQTTFTSSGAERTTDFGARNGNQIRNYGEQSMEFANQAEGVANTMQAWSGDGDTTVRGHFNGTGQMDQTVMLNGNSKDVTGNMRAYGTIEAGTQINGQSGGSLSFQESEGNFQIAAGNKNFGQPQTSDVNFALRQYGSTEGGSNGGGFSSSTSNITDYATVRGSADAN